VDVLDFIDAIKTHYQKLDDFGKWWISYSINCLEIPDKQTLQMFKDLLVRAAMALMRQGVVVADTFLKQSISTLHSWYKKWMDSKA
jgi:hypothetical protein